MRLFLKNIGKIDTALVEINGITVIAGQNNTGKSTVGRALFSVFNSLYNIDGQIRIERVRSIEKLIEMIDSRCDNRFFRFIYESSSRKEIARSIASRASLLRDDENAIRGEIDTAMQCNGDVGWHLDDKDIDSFVLRMKELLNVSDADIFKAVLGARLNKEFHGQVSNIFTDDAGEIQLTVKDRNVRISVDKNGAIDMKDWIKFQTEAVYLDDPFVLDKPLTSGQEFRSAGHQEHLRTKLMREADSNVVEEIVANKKLENIYRKITDVCSGDVIRKSRLAIGYRRKNSDKVLDARNLSAGLKTFVILKQLLLNGVIKDHGTVILDEPEIHLHPEWQLLFAELIVMIQKEFGLHVLMNTHSPYFLRAVQVYAAKYESADQCKYYLAEAENEKARIVDVTDDIERIYDKLARPLQQLEDVRWQDG